jgi:hypothetical protein
MAASRNKSDFFKWLFFTIHDMAIIETCTPTHHSAKGIILPCTTLIWEWLLGCSSTTFFQLNSWPGSLFHHTVYWDSSVLFWIPSQLIVYQLARWRGYSRGDKKLSWPCVVQWYLLNLSRYWINHGLPHLMIGTDVWAALGRDFEIGTHILVVWVYSTIDIEQFRWALPFSSNFLAPPQCSLRGPLQISLSLSSRKTLKTDQDQDLVTYLAFFQGRENLNENFPTSIYVLLKPFMQILPSDSKKACGILALRPL